MNVASWLRPSALARNRAASAARSSASASASWSGKTLAPTLTLSGSPECRRRLDCKLGLERSYGLRFKRYLPTALPDRHTVLTSGKADVSIVFSTDGQIAADDLLVLEDDKKLFPPYNVSLVVNDEAAKRAGPDLPKIVGQV